MQPARCIWCGRPAGLLCDGLVAGPVIGPGRKLVRPAVTCDVPLCRAHAFRLGTMHIDMTGPRRGVWDTIDYCPDCLARDELKRSTHG